MVKIYLSKILGEMRITQAELARKTGIRPTNINEIYHELVDRINLEHLSKICEVLDCRIDDILEYIPDDEYYQYKTKSLNKNKAKK